MTDAALPNDIAALQALLLRERERVEQQAAVIEQLRQERDEVVESVLLDPQAASLDQALQERERAAQERAQECEQQAAVIEQLQETVTKQRQTIEQQERQIAQLLRKLFGPQRERIDPDQLLLFDNEELQALADELAAQTDGTDENDGDEETTSNKKKKRGHGRQRLPEHLPREEVVYELDEHERGCPCCGEQREVIGEERSEQLEFTPAVFKIIEHVRIKYACKSCEEHVALAPKPPQPIDKGLPGPGLLAQVALSKYGDHLPLYRQEDIFARWGIIIRRSTQCDWIAAMSDLVDPLYRRLCDLTVQSHVLHTDDTSVKLIDLQLGHAVNARFWAYVGDELHPYTVFDFTRSRKRDGPAEFLEHFQGVLQADAYGGYDGIFTGSKGGVIEAACWAHCRRYWWEVREVDPIRAHRALGWIAQLFALERQFQDLSHEDRRAARQRYARPLIDAFGAWLETEYVRVLPKSAIGKAFTYTRNQWQALQTYLDDGAVAIDNNVAERAVKIVAIGRKNWLFVASETGGTRAAKLLSLIASCKQNEVDPWYYLRDVFATLPLLGATPSQADLDPLLPDQWLKSHPEHRWRIQEVRNPDAQ